MDQVVGAAVVVALIGLIAHINSGAIVGAVVAVRSSVRDAWVYAAGMSAARVIQLLFGTGAVIAILSNLLGQLLLERYTQVLLLVVGLIVLLSGVREVRSPSKHLPESGRGDAAPTEEESRNEATTSAGTFFWSSFGLTILSPRQWIFASLAVSTIASARLGVPGSLMLTALYILSAAWITIALGVMRLVRPRRADEIIARADRWVEQHSGRLLAWGQVVIGAAMLGLGVWLLAG